jgi:hypothetical protein
LAYGIFWNQLPGVLRFPRSFVICAAVYGLVLLITALLLPLRLGEILHAAALEQFSWHRFFRWVAWTPGAAPLSYLVQIPALVALHSRLALRLPSWLFAVGSCGLFFRLVNLVPLRRPYLALAAFLVAPVHYYFAAQGRPFEQGLFLLLLASILFFRLVETPGVPSAVLYGAVLTACLYTEPACFWPACGYVLGLLRFAPGRAERRALWFALPATVVPPFLFAIYYTSVGGQADPWLNEPIQTGGLASQIAAALAPGDWGLLLGVPLAVLLLLGLIVGVWSSFPPLGTTGEGRPPVNPLLLRKWIVLFCLAGGTFVTILAEAALGAWNQSPFAPNSILWAIPGLIILFFAALERLSEATLPKPLVALHPALRALSPALAVLLIALCLPADANYLVKRPGDVAALSSLIQPELTKKACVVFVSEHLSRYIWVLFQPDVEKYECHNFFHSRVVLAEHPWVRPEQQHAAEQYFRGMNFIEKKRQTVAGGQIVTFETGN